METPQKIIKPEEIYGFVGWIATFFFIIFYLLWAFIPDTVLNDLGIHYYPSKHWAKALPCLITMFLFMFVWWNWFN